ncbi:tRNA (guanine(9)-N(1))-methyltransferase [Amphichorda felina]
MSSVEAGELPPQSADAPAGSSAPSTNDAEATTLETDPEKKPPPAPMSKNALKRLRKQQEWEDGKDDRRKRRKEKRHERKGRARERREALLAQGVDRDVVFPRRKPAVQVPVSLVLDCDFEPYMTDKERISLSSQVTRSYADNRTAKFRAHLWVAGWRGKLLDRFEGTLDSQHRNWKGVGFHEGDFAECAQRAAEKMRGPRGGRVVEPLQRSLDQPVAWVRDERDPIPLPDPEPEPSEEYKDIVYLTSDSPYTLDRLEPYKTYVIGGLVDKNREKGLCYRRAREKGIRTARLPIGQFMVMQSRQVLATNHVVEIMLKWIEYEDWGEAFAAVIPKRKGGVLRSGTPGEQTPGEGSDAEDSTEAGDEEETEMDRGESVSASPDAAQGETKPEVEQQS